VVERDGGFATSDFAQLADRAGAAISGITAIHSSVRYSSSWLHKVQTSL
jgi:hypothetical protein